MDMHENDKDKDKKMKLDEQGRTHMPETGMGSKQVAPEHAKKS